MSSSPDAANTPVKSRRRRWRWARIGVALALLAAAGYWFFHKPPEASQSGTTFAVRRGPLSITVLEGGSVAALESQDIKSEVQGQTKILSIVEEGYAVTPEDVQNGKILVELDSKDLVDRLTAKELEYLNAAAAFTGAVADYEIQINQNRSDLTAAELIMKFALLDFERYLGVDTARELLTKLGLLNSDKEAERETQLALTASAELLAKAEADAQKPGEDSGPDKDTEIAHAPIDFSEYANAERLGDGEAQQKLRTLQDASVLAKKELGLAKTQFEGTKRLAEKNFVTTTDLENDRLKVERSEISLASAETAKDLFIKYEFPKESEKRLSDYEESLRKLQRARKLAISKLAQADARRKASEASYKLQTQKRDELKEQIEKCKVQAKREGMVVYGGDANNWHGDDRIQEGAIIRERQQILTIPDMNQMGVKVKIHESSIKSIEKGQKARVNIDAYPDMQLTGEVVKVGILPDAENRWMNPDMKVYEVKLSIEGVHDWLKPGMSAQVEVLVKELPDVLQVPIQAVTPSDGGKVCFVADSSGCEKREVDVGEFNNEFIEIKNGLQEGEEVLLRAPVSPEAAGAAQQDDKAKNDGKKGDEEAQPKPKSGEAPRQENAPAPETKPGKPA